MFVTNIDPNVDIVRELTPRIRTGKVFAVDPIKMEPSKNIFTKAAKLVFFRPQSAAAFLRRIQGFPGIVFFGTPVQGRYNRHGYFENSNPITRVLQIRGSPELEAMKPDFWTLEPGGFFSSVKYELEESRIWFEGPVKCLEFRFARVVSVPKEDFICSQYMFENIY